jgi:hypothetical protein
MWEYEYSVETSAAPEAIWALWADVNGWGAWNAGLEKIEIHGPFAPGTAISMVPTGQEEIRLVLAEVVDNELFVDEADFGEVLIRTAHRLERLDDGRTRVVYRTEITGPAAGQVGPELGPAITEDFPETIDALLTLAQAG